MSNVSGSDKPAFQQPARKILTYLLSILLLLLVAFLVTTWLHVPSVFTVGIGVIVGLGAGVIAISREEMRASRIGRVVPTVLALGVVVALVLVISTVAVTRANTAGTAVAAGPTTIAAVLQPTTVPPSELPFTVSVDGYAPGGCGTYLFRDGTQPTEPLRSKTMPQITSILRSLNAVQAANFGSKGYVNKSIITFTGIDRAPVTLTGISFEIVKRSDDPLHGPVYSGQCGSDTTGAFIETDMNSTPPSITATNTNPAGLWGSGGEGMPNESRLDPIEFP